MLSWPSSGDSVRVWAINPSAWGMDTNAVGPTVFQPILFAGQYQDVETAAYENDGATIHRPGVVLNGYRTYDPFTGTYLQVDPLADETWNSYVYTSSNPIGNSDPSGLEMIDNVDWQGKTQALAKEAGGPAVGGSSGADNGCPHTANMGTILGLIAGIFGGLTGIWLAIEVPFAVSSELAGAGMAMTSGALIGIGINMPLTGCDGTGSGNGSQQAQ
jgi:RHS repeat-associated protein